MTGTTWIEQAKGWWPSVPATDYLQKLPISEALKLSLGASLYRVKHGESVWLQTDEHSPETLTYVASYLHACRIEALSGAQRANWLNQRNMAERTDLVVWSAASFQNKWFSKKPDLGTQWIRLEKSLKANPVNLFNSERICRTLLCKPSESLSGLFDGLTSYANVFLQLLDFTPLGERRHIENLLEHCHAYYEKAPVFIISSVFDDQSTDLIKKKLPTVIHWRQTTADQVLTDVSRHKSTTSLSVIEIPDNTINESLHAAYALYRELDESLPPNCIEKKLLKTALFKVLNTLRSLILPLKFVEYDFEAHSRGGPFPVKPLTAWIADIDGMDLPNGKSEQYKIRLVTLLNEMLVAISNGDTGKQQAFKKWINQASPEEQRLLVTSGERDVSTIRKWLAAYNNSLLESGAVQIVGVSSVRSCYRHLTGRYKECLVIGALWSDGLWIMARSTNAQVLAYPCEITRAAKSGKAFLSAMQPTSTGKDAWWYMNDARYAAPPLIDDDINLECWRDCAGTYPIFNTVKVDLAESTEWIDELVESYEIKSGHFQAAEYGDVTITTDVRKHLLREKETVYKLSGMAGSENLEQVQATEIEVGDVIITTDTSDVDVTDVMGMLLDQVYDNSTQYAAYRDIAQQWFDIVDHANFAAGSPEALRIWLKNEGINNTIQTIRRWCSHTGIKPNDTKRVIQSLAQKAKIQMSENKLNSICHALSHIHGLHSQLGKMIRQYARSELASNTSFVSKIEFDGIPEDLIADLVALETVDRVDHHPIQPASMAFTPLELLKNAVKNSTGKLKMTSRAESSAADCLYTDTLKMKRALDLLSDSFWNVYANAGLQMKDAVEKATGLGIQFKGDTSDKTKGRYESDYLRVYNGQQVDIGRHLAIGTSRDQKRCFRLYFHWDTVEQAIVIHHFGKHLPTSKG